MDINDAFEKDLDGHLARAKAIMLEKRKLRGRGNITNQGLLGVVNRLAEDKMSRLKRSAENIYLRKLLLERGVNINEVDRIAPQPNANDYHGVEDDLYDTANYAFIALMVINNQW